MTDDGFGALMCQKCAQSQIRLGEWGGGGGGGGGGVGEPRTGIIYTYIFVHTFTWFAQPAPKKAAQQSLEEYKIAPCTNSRPIGASKS